MEAVVLEAFGKASVQDIPQPSPSSDEVLVKVKRVQLSVTECQLYRGEKVGHYDNIRRRIEDGGAQVFGHEFCGEIVEVGDDVEEFSVGDRVYAAGKVNCRECKACREGLPHLCTDKEAIGLERPGALSEYFTVPTRPLHKLPDDISDAEGAAMQPLAAAVLCARDTNIENGDVVMTIGAGIMGYQIGQIALHQGAGKVISVDLVEEKLDLAEKQGMIPVDATETDPVEYIHSITDDVGADVVFECVGGDQSHGTNGDEPLAQALKCVRSRGVIEQVGNIGGELSITPRAMRAKHVRWIHPTRSSMNLGPNSHSGDYAPQLVASGRVSIEEFITHELNGLESFEEAMNITTNAEEHGALGPPQIIVE